MLLHVSNAKYLDGYRIVVQFSDGRSGVVDLVASLNGPVFAVLKNQHEFEKFTVDEDLKTIVWQSGADMAPEYLYFQAFKQQKELQPLFQQWGYVA